MTGNSSAELEVISGLNGNSKEKYDRSHQDQVVVQMRRIYSTLKATKKNHSSHVRTDISSKLITEDGQHHAHKWRVLMLNRTSLPFDYRRLPVHRLSTAKDPLQRVLPTHLTLALIMPNHIRTAYQQAQSVCWMDSSTRSAQTGSLHWDAYRMVIFLLNQWRPWHAHLPSHK